MSGIFATPIFISNHDKRKVYMQKYGDRISFVIYAMNFTSGEENSVLSALDIARYCPKLLQFRGDTFHDESVLTALAGGYPLLECLTVIGHSCSADAVLSLSRGCTRLKRLDLSAPTGDVYEECLVALVRTNPGLVSFIAHCGSTTSRLLCEIAMNCSNLEEVVLSLVGITEAAIHLLLQRCTRLRSLSLTNCMAEETEEGLQRTVSASLKELFLNNVALNDDELLALLQACPSLTSLTVLECLELEHLDMVQFGTLCPSLEELRLRDNSSAFDDAALEDITENCPALRVLQIPESQDVSDAALTALVIACPLLEELDIAGCMDVTDRFLYALAEHGSSLIALNAIGCPRITYDGLEMLSQGCSNLKDVHVE
jgi:hypothetical protein